MLRGHGRDFGDTGPRHLASHVREASGGVIIGTEKCPVQGVRGASSSTRKASYVARLAEWGPRWAS